MKIDRHNYEEWMVAFIDGELEENELAEFKTFLDKNPELKKELVAFEDTKFVADTSITFDSKASLYKKAGALLLLKKAWPLAAALVLMLSIWTFTSQEKMDTKTTIAENNKKESSLKIVTPKPKKESTIKPLQQNQIKEEVVLQERKKQSTALPSEREKSISKKAIAHTKILHKKTPPIAKEPFEKLNPKKDLPEQMEPLKEVKQKTIVVQEEVKTKTPEPKQIIEKPVQEILVQQPKEISPELNPIQETVASIETKNALVRLDEKHHPKLYKKINSAITEVENKIEKIKELKRTPITVCIGKRKLFTINTANAAQAN